MNKSLEREEASLATAVWKVWVWCEKKNEKRY